MNWIEALPANRRRGSYPRCLLFMEGEQSLIADKMTQLVGLDDVIIPKEALWMPKGIPIQLEDNNWDLTPTFEAKIGEADCFLSPENRKVVTDWWLKITRNANTPNWDIASTCTIQGKQGLLLIEAKAHLNELSTNGKSKPRTPNGKKNDARIRKAISEADSKLNQLRPGWNLSCDSHYQLCNRFAWSWKLASMGIPVVLMYLGFLDAKEMVDLSQPFNSFKIWDKAVREHSDGIAPASVWNEKIDVKGTTFIACIRSTQVDLSSNTARSDG